MNNTTNGTSILQIETRTLDTSAKIMIAMYITIFVLAVIGNCLVILTLIQNTRMRTVTNVFLLNLAVSDLLLAAFCMPFTLIPIHLKNFIFGPFMCVAIRYAQGVSVAASCFTLVAISLERYFAICKPLHSRRWQTLSHAYKIIILCWMLALIIVLPIPIATSLMEGGQGRMMCVEIWKNNNLEKAYTIFLDVVLLFIPLCLMTGSYTRIMVTLCTGIKQDAQVENCTSQSIVSMRSKYSKTTNNKTFGGYVTRLANKPCDKNYLSIQMTEISPCSSEESSPRRKYDTTRIIRQSNQERSRKAKIRVVKMLFVLVIEFFVCWTPLYTVQTWKSFHHESAKEMIPSAVWSTIFVLAFFSSCCNPITYCFMNNTFRQAFMNAVMRCICCKRVTSATYKPNTSTRRLTWFDSQKPDETELSSSEKTKNGLL